VTQQWDVHHILSLTPLHKRGDQTLRCTLEFTRNGRTLKVSTGPDLKDPLPRMDGLGAAGCITKVRETTIVTP
jgi:hypothetical protein